MILTVEAIEKMAKQIRTARAAQNRAAIDELIWRMLAMGIRLNTVLHECRYSILHAALRNDAQRLRELRERYLDLRKIDIEWRLVAQELGVFSQDSANGCDSGGGSCPACAPAASFTEVRDA